MHIRATRETPDGSWIAVDDDTYDGAPDAPPRDRAVGCGGTEEAAIRDLVEQLEYWDESTPVATPDRPQSTPTAEELAMRIAWVGTGLIYFLRHPEQTDAAARGLGYAERLARIARDASTICRARGGPELGGCDVCESPACYRNQPGAYWPDEPVDEEDVC